MMQHTAISKPLSSSTSFQSSYLEALRPLQTISGITIGKDSCLSTISGFWNDTDGTGDE